MQQTCTKCSQTKPLTEYYRDRSRLTGRQPQCKACRYKPVDIDRRRTTTSLDCGTKVCRDCDQPFEPPNPRYKQARCPSCYNAHRRSTYVRKRKPPTPQVIEQRKQRIRERARERARRARLENPEKIRAQERASRRKRRQDPKRRLRDNITSLVCNAMSRQGYTKQSRTQEILGCSYDEFVVWIESQFSEGMTWSNRELWHIDHRVPISCAENEAEVVFLNHYTNLQPLWARDNQSKFTTVDETDPVYLALLDLRMGKR